ncbi:MAG TPA: phosphatase PAP2 family protein [Ktedonobacteraceae bacterium]|nr:phosphatase PAP2 family protein [Ktedonobacteraceae bacterium]
MHDYRKIQPQDPIVFEKTRHIRIARFISNLLAPVTISLPAVVLIALYHTRDTFSALLYSALTLFFLSLGPMAYILVGMRMGKISDIDISRRHERVGPFLFGLASIALGLMALTFTNGPGTLKTLLLISAISGMLMMLITFWWKISLHASTLAGALTFLTALYGYVMLPLFTLLIMVSWSRVVLRRHTVPQVIAGAIVSIVLTSIILKLRGL